MTHKHDGGPAFPDPGRAQSAKQRGILGNPGMSLRDYFAAKVLIGLCSGRGYSHLEVHAQLTASTAYIVADAMIAQRENENDP